jgi:hypothetical protein
VGVTLPRPSLTVGSKLRCFSTSMSLPRWPLTTNISAQTPFLISPNFAFLYGSAVAEWPWKGIL